jgi:DNA-damage-inducible protein J
MSIRIDSDVKAKAQALFSALGIDMTTAINIFLRQAIQHQGIPFNVTLTKPNQETLDAMAEVVENPYVRQKTTITIRLDKETVDYFKNLSAEIKIPYQRLMSAYLTDCAMKQRKPVLAWTE